DFISAAPSETGRGVGGALYERVRDECRLLSVAGLFFECLPDEPQDVSDPAVLPAHPPRLKFYERRRARPPVGTAHNKPVRPGHLAQPYLVFDDLGTGAPLRRATARAIVRAILERKYAWLCSPEYIDQVVESIRDDPVRVRPPRYTRPSAPRRAPAA